MTHNNTHKKINLTFKSLFVFLSITLLVVFSTVLLSAEWIIIVLSAGLLTILGLSIAYKWPDMFVILAIWVHFLKGLFIPKLSLGDFGTTPFMVFVTLAVVGYGLQIILGKRQFVLPVGFLFLLIFIGFTTFSLLVVQDFRAAIGVYFRTVLDWALFFVIVQMIVSRKRMQQLIYALLLQAVVVVSWGILAGIQLERLNVPRNTLFFWRQFQKNDFAAYLAIVIVIALATILVSKIRWEKLFSLYLLIMAPLAWVFTFSRGGFLAIVISVGVFIALERRKRILQRLFIMLFIVGLFSLTTVTLAPSSTRDLALDGLISIVSGESTAQRHTDTIEFRFALAEYATGIIAEKPILGVGFNQWQFYSPVKTRIYEAQTGQFREVGFSIHNRFLLIAANSGIIALVGYIGYLIFVILLGVRSRRYANQWTKTYLNAFISSIIGIQVALLFAPFVVWEWPTLGILAGLINLVEIETKGTLSLMQRIQLKLKT